MLNSALLHWTLYSMSTVLHGASTDVVIVHIAQSVQMMMIVYNIPQLIQVGLMMMTSVY
jgi:hypothetical protein